MAKNGYREWSLFHVQLWFIMASVKGRRLKFSEHQDSTKKAWLYTSRIYNPDDPDLTPVDWKKIAEDGPGYRNLLMPPDILARASLFPELLPWYRPPDWLDRA